MVSPTLLLTALVLVGGLAALYSSVRIVDEGRLEALFLFGEMKRVLEPGLNVVPPFVSRSYAIDPERMTIEQGHEQVAVPVEFEPTVRAYGGGGSEPRSTGAYSESAAPSADLGEDSSKRERLATMIGIGLFVVGAFGMAVPVIMISHMTPIDRWALSGWFTDATVLDVGLTALASIVVMFVGETIATQYGTWDS